MQILHDVGEDAAMDPTAVVDSQLRVKGIEGLRVADASIMPCVTSNNIHAPVIMIGEKCAALMRSNESVIGSKS